MLVEMAINDWFEEIVAQSVGENDKGKSQYEQPQVELASDCLPEN